MFLVKFDAVRFAYLFALFCTLFCLFVRIIIIRPIIIIMNTSESVFALLKH